MLYVLDIMYFKIKKKNRSNGSDLILSLLFNNFAILSIHEYINPNIFYRKSYAIFKYLKEVLLINKVQIKKCELWKNLLKIKKWRNEKYGKKGICLESY